MTLSLAPITEFKMPLTIKQPSLSGEPEVRELTATWAYLSKDDRKTLQDEIKRAVSHYQDELAKFAAGELEEQPEIQISDAEICKRLLLNLEPLEIKKGKKVKFKPEHIDLIDQMDYAATPLYQQMNEVISGAAIQEILEKN